MIEICSLAPALADRLSEIYDELKVCTDDLKRKSLINERDIKRDDDVSANEHLEATGSYLLFDEPCSVKIARAALARYEKGE